ncbi:MULTISPECIES: HlyD family secretion protein [unclassified Duganella]|uniref:HlyD family secretion protein n=1 Tax=unclassified Duganella TaxID=2636909 RepID=UPI001E5113E6|nr:MULTISPECIES: HlyD family efflux transporter periplasmic adaptor subunit [unclassified Duganella]
MWFFAIGVGLICFFIFFSTTRKAKCQGVLLPTAGIVRIIPAQAGVILESRVVEGQIIKAGDILFVLSGERSSQLAGSTQKVVSTLLGQRKSSYDDELKQVEQQARQRVAALEQRSRDLALEVERASDQITLQERRVVLAEQSNTRYVDLQSTGYLSVLQMQEKQGELLDQRQRLVELQRAQAVSQRDLRATKADINDQRVQAQREIAALQRNAGIAEQELTENEARRQILVRAPNAGMVTAVTTEPGQTVTGQTVLASVLPTGAELEAEIYAPSRSAGFIKRGMKVLLRYQAYPYQKFGQYPAEVREVANTSLQPNELVIPGVVTNTSGEPLYRIRLKLHRQSAVVYGKAMPLKAGMLIDASIELEHRRLYEWILEPLFSLSGRI